jgi:signal transduction histidine kinase
MSDEASVPDLSEESVRMVSLAVAAASLGVWRADPKADRLWIKGPARALMGMIEGEEFIDAARWLSALHPDDRDGCVEALKAMSGLAVGQPYRLTFQLADPPSGGPVWIEAVGSRLPAEEEAYAGIFIDATERKTSEQAMAERERRISEAADAGLAAIWVNDHAAGLQHLTGQVTEHFGGRDGRVTLRKEDWPGLLHPDDFEAVRRAFARLEAGGPAGPVDYRVRVRGGWRWMRSAGQVTAHDASGRAVRSTGIVTDVTAEKEFAQALDVERRRLSDALESARQGAWRLDYTTGTVEFTAFGAALVGLPSGVLSCSLDVWRSHIHPDDRHLCVGGVEAMGKGQDLLEVYRVRHPDKGWRWVEDRGSVTLRGDDGAALEASGTMVDVSERQELEIELARYAERLERTNRELDRFATVASHDLQEPLRKIAAFASLLKRRYAGRLDADADTSLDFLIDAAGRMRRLIDDLLGYSKASSRDLETRPVDMEVLARDVVEELDWAIAEAGAQVEIDPLPVIDGDPTLLRSLLQNLVSNGVKYRRGAGPVILISAQRQDDVWRFCVADDGMGIDPRFHEAVFAPFRRLHGRDAGYEGSGIGLAICQQAVERHGGRIWVKSQPGQGSAFFFTLPARKSASAAAE